MYDREFRMQLADRYARRRSPSSATSSPAWTTTLVGREADYGDLGRRERSAEFKLDKWASFLSRVEGRILTVEGSTPPRLQGSSTCWR